MFSSTIKPYKFVNPSSISAGGGGATIIAGGKKITGGMTPQIKSARVTMLAINRIGMAMEGLGKTQQQIRDIIVYENKYLTKSSDFKRKREGYRRDQKSEARSESFGKNEKEGIAKEVVKKEKKQLSWLEKIFGPFVGIISFVGRFVIGQTVLRWMADPKNTDKLTVFVKSFGKVFKWAFNIAYKSTDAVLSGFAKVFGSSDKKGLDRFGEVLGGLGQLLIGIAGFKALGYLLNPFSLVNDIIGLVDMLSAGGGGGGKPSVDGKPEAAKPRAAAQKVAENYGDDAARYYDDLISRGKKPGDALKAVRGRFKKIPPKPKGLFDKVGDTFGNIKKGLGKGFEKIKGFAGGITRGMRDKLVKSGEFLKSSTQKAMQPIAKKAYEFLESKGVIKLANSAGEKAVGIIKKMPGFSKIMSKVQKEGGEAVLKKLGAKSIPVIGGLVNLYFAYDRLKNGDRSGAALEAISAILDIAGLFTGGATSALSMVLDTYLFGRDFFPDLVKSENAAFGKLINTILGPINSIKDSLPKVPFLKDGGIVNKPTRAILGEDGPEVVLPLSKLGGEGALVSTIVGATQSALSRMGAAGEVAKALIGGDLSAAENIFGVKGIKGSAGDTLGKSVMKASKGVEEIDAGNDISIYLGKDNVVIKDNKQPANKPTTLRGQLANILGALIWVSKKNISGGGSSGPGAPGPAPSKGSGGMLPGDAPPIIKAMLDAIAAAEGGWDSVNPGTTVSGLSNMTIADARRAAMAKGYGMGGSGAMGKWQQMPQFILERSRSAGLDPNKDIFNQENQTKIARMLMAGVYPGGEKQLVADAQQNPLKAAANLRGTWPSLPGGSQENVHSKNFVAHFNQNVSKYAKMAQGGELKKPSSYMSRERRTVIEPQLAKAKQLDKFAAGGAHRVIPDTPSTSWAAGIPLTYVTSSTGKKAEVAVPLAKRFQAFIKELEATGYKINEIGGFRPDGPPAGNVDGKGPQYAHPYGAAIDINWTKNPAFVGKRFGDFPRNSGEIASKYGLGWGSKFDDAMHFSAMKREYGAGIDGQEITGKSLGGSKEGVDYKPGSSSGSSVASGSTTTEEPETIESVFAKLESAIAGLNTSLGYTPAAKPAATSSVKPAAPTTKPTPAASSSGSQMSKASEEAARLEEASAAVQGSAQIVPMPINTSVNVPAAFSGQQVYYPRSPITYGI
jgi:hypothetical protein